jgi:hypothetical protein
MKTILAVLLTAALFSTPAAAQEGKSEQSTERGAARPETAGALYRVAVTVKELDGNNKVNSRAYTVMVRPQGPGQPHQGQLRVGSRVPILTGKESMQYMDVGMKIDVFNARELEGLFTGTITIEMNTVVPGEVQAGAPVLRDLRLTAPFVLTPGKAAIVGTVDDVNSRRTFQVEVTATKLR